MKRARKRLFSRKYRSANYVIYSKLFLSGAPSHRAFAHSSPRPGQLRSKATPLQETEHLAARGRQKEGTASATPFFPRQAGITKHERRGRARERGMQGRHFRIHLGAFISLVTLLAVWERVMRVPELCKMHNQAFKYTPGEWTMCTHVQLCARACVCGVV